MRRTTKLGLMTAGALALAAAGGQAALAGCGGGSLAPASLVRQGGDDPLLVRAAFLQPSIVGMWSFNMYDGTGKMIDFGYVQWHADGTEIMNSGSRDPATENFCMGAWGQTGPNRFSLNHFALSYDKTTGNLNAKVNIKETIFVTGNTYSGTFTEYVTDPSGAALGPPVTGRVVAQRILP